MELERIEPTRRIAFVLWWGLVWRFLLALILIGLLHSFLFAVLVSFFDLDPTGAKELWRAVALIVTLPLALLASGEVIYRILWRRFDTFELAVLEHGSESEPEHLHKL